MRERLRGVPSARCARIRVLGSACLTAPARLLAGSAAAAPVQCGGRSCAVQVLLRRRWLRAARRVLSVLVVAVMRLMSSRANEWRVRRSL